MLGRASAEPPEAHAARSALLLSVALIVADAPRGEMQAALPRLPLLLYLDAAAGFIVVHVCFLLLLLYAATFLCLSFSLLVSFFIKAPGLASFDLAAGT